MAIRLVDLIAVMLRLAAPTVLLTLGGMFFQKIKIFPIGLEAMMMSGCFFVVWGTYLTNNPYMGCLIAGITVMIVSLVFAFFVFELGVNSVVCGFSLYTIIYGFSRYLLSALYGLNGTMRLDNEVSLPKIDLPIIKDIPVLGDVFSGHSFLVYLALILPFALHYFLYRTNFGLNLRAVGANPEAAQMTGINVNKTRYIALAIGGFLCGLGGAQLAMAANLYTVGMTDGRGFTAVAALVLANAEPILSFFVCLLYGLTDGLVIQLSGYGYNPQFLATLPYFVAIFAAVIPPVIRGIRTRVNRRQFQQQIAQYKITSV